MKKKERRKEGKEGGRGGRKGGKKEGEPKKAAKEKTAGKLDPRASQLLGDQIHQGSSPWFLGPPKSKQSKSLLVPAPEPLDGTKKTKEHAGPPPTGDFHVPPEGPWQHQVFRALPSHHCH